MSPRGGGGPGGEPRWAGPPRGAGAGDRQSVGGGGELNGGAGRFAMGCSIPPIPSTQGGRGVRGETPRRWLTMAGTPQKAELIGAPDGLGIWAAGGPGSICAGGGAPNWGGGGWRVGDGGKTFRWPKNRRRGGPEKPGGAGGGPRRGCSNRAPRPIIPGSPRPPSEQGPPSWAKADPPGEEVGPGEGPTGGAGERVCLDMSSASLNLTRGAGRGLV